MARSVGGLRAAAEAVVVAWEGGADLAPAMEALKAALAPAPKAPRTPRAGTKNEAVLTLLRRGDGASIARIIEASERLEQIGFEVRPLQRRRPHAIQDAEIARWRDVARRADIKPPS